MLDLREFNNDVYIYSSELDEWGMPIISPTGNKVKGYIKEQIEFKEMGGQKGKSTLISYTVSLPHYVRINPKDQVGILINGTIKKFPILSLSISRDLSGEPVLYKVWI
jgi:hypothetical protein